MILIARFFMASMLSIALFASFANAQSVKKAPAPKPAVSGNGGGIIYVYWPRGFFDPILPNLPEWMKIRHDIAIDGKVAGELTKGEYTVLRVTPGKRYIDIKQGGLDLGSLFGNKGTAILVGNGTSLYFQVYIENNAVFLSQRPASEGQANVSQLKRFGR
ncbi:MAG: hypothetical protein SGJ17_04565 [Hyphomicrobiales bacterium]|nr:hypothetical protein [Hyphomicrobiales bacterium]